MITVKTVESGKKITDTLSVAGAPLDLTGATVELVMRRPDGTVAKNAAGVAAPATAGVVEYALLGPDLLQVGRYQLEWEVTRGAEVLVFPPEGYLQMEVLDTVATSPGGTPIADTYELIRAILGDHDPQFPKYEDLAIANVVRTMVRLGRVKSAVAGVEYGLSADRRSIVPALGNAKDLALLTYHAALTFLGPDAAEYSYRTRALSERFGSQKYFLFELKNLIWETENEGGGMFHTFQSFYGWVNATTGLNVWSVMTDMETQAPVGTVTVSRAGITVS